MYVSSFCILLEGLIFIEANQQALSALWRGVVKALYTFSVKQTFKISELFIQYNTDSCCEQITGCVNICLHVSVSLLVPVCEVCVCALSNRSTSNSHDQMISQESKGKRNGHDQIYEM